MASRKPVLALKTPISDSFPADALKSAVSVRTPLSAACREPLPSAGLPSSGLLATGLPSAGLSSAGLQSPIVTVKMEDGLTKTPVNPPVAYMDFLRLVSPVTSPAKPPAPSPLPVASRPRIPHRASISGPFKAQSIKAHQRAVADATAAAAAAASASASAAAASASASTTTSAAARASRAPKSTISSTSSAGSGDEMSSGNDTCDDQDTTMTDSAPSTATSTTSSACSCDCEQQKKGQKGLQLQQTATNYGVDRPRKSPKVARIDTSLPWTPFAISGSGNTSAIYSAGAGAGNSAYPMSAPAFGHTTFPSLHVPISPAISNASKVNSPIRSPFSAKSTTLAPVFDWESALKARYAEFKAPHPPPSTAIPTLTQKQYQPQAQQHKRPTSSTTCSKCSAKKISRTPLPPGPLPATTVASLSTSASAASSTSSLASAASSSTTTTTATVTSPPLAKKPSVRHIREVVTRTVTYMPRITPRMNPAPKGKKRKMECDESAC